MSADLSWLSTAEAKPAEFAKSRRGRQPGPNPMADHVAKTHATGKPLSLTVPAGVASKVERLIRKAGTDNGWSLTVQFSRNMNGKDELIPLRSLGELKDSDEDLTVTFAATDKPADADQSESADADEKPAAPAAAVADPFAGDAKADEKPAKSPVRKAVRTGA